MSLEIFARNGLIPEIKELIEEPKPLKEGVIFLKRNIAAGDKSMLYIPEDTGLVYKCLYKTENLDRTYKLFAPWLGLKSSGEILDTEVQDAHGCRVVRLVSISDREAEEYSEELLRRGSPAQAD